MPYSFTYFRRMLDLHARIQATRATTTSDYGRQWVRVMNSLRYRMAYALPR